MGGARRPDHAGPGAASVPRSRRPAVHPDPLPDSAAATSALWTLGIGSGGNTVKGRPSGPGLRPGNTSLEGWKPHALAQAGLSGNSLRYGPGSSRHVPGAERATVRSAAGAKQRAAPPARLRPPGPRCVSPARPTWAPLSTAGALDASGGELGAGGPRRIRPIVSRKHLGRRLRLDRNCSGRVGRPHVDCKYCRRRCCSLIYGFLPRLLRLASFSNADSL